MLRWYRRRIFRTVCVSRAIRRRSITRRGGGTEGDEKLRVVGVLGAIVCAGDQPLVGKPQPRVYLVPGRSCTDNPRVNTNPPNRTDCMKHTSVDGFATSARAGPITGLDKEV